MKYVDLATKLLRKDKTSIELTDIIDNENRSLFAHSSKILIKLGCLTINI